VGLTQPQKNPSKQNNPKRFDDLNRAMRSGGQNLCANEMPNFSSDNNKEDPKKKPRQFSMILYGLQEHDSRTLPSVDFGVLICPPLRDVKTLGF